MVVGLLAAVGAIMSARVGLAHGDLVDALTLGAAATAGLGAYLTAPASKKSLKYT
jgi:hypothetical protein